MGGALDFLTGNSASGINPNAEFQTFDVTDLISNVSQRVVTRPDGTKEVIVERLPLSPQEEKFAADLQSFVNQGLTDLQELTKVSAAIDLEAFKPVTDAVRAQQERTLDAAFEQRQRQEEEFLAATGLQDSTAAVQARAVRGQDFQEAFRQIGDDVTLLAENLRQQQLGRTLSGLGFATGRQDVASQLTAAAQANVGALGLNFGNAANQFAQQNIQNQLAVGQIKAQDRAALFQAVGTAVGFGFSGGFGGGKKGE